MKAWQVILATMVIFGAGVVTGGLFVKHVGHVQNPHPPANAAPHNAPAPWHLQRVEFIRRLEKQLDLSPDQRKRVEDIMRESQERTKPLWEGIGPQLREELKNVREQIRAELTPQQQKKFDEELLKSRSFGKLEGSPASEEHRHRDPSSGGRSRRSSPTKRLPMPENTPP